MENLTYLQLDGFRLEQPPDLLCVDYSTEERERAVPKLSFGYVQHEKLKVQDLEWNELPARVRKDALQWLRAQRESVDSAIHPKLFERIVEHIEALEHIAA